MFWKAPVVFWIAFGVSAWAQLPGLPSNSASAAPASTDAYGRASPRGTVVGFLDAAQSHNWTRSLRYLEVPPKMKTAEIEDLPKHLKYVLDNQVINLNRISNNPQGTLDDNLPPDEELIVSVKSDSGSTGILLHRVKNGDGQIWLFSANSLKEIDKLAQQVDRPVIEHYLPHFLVIQTHIFSLRLWQMLSLLIAVPISFLISSLITRLLIALLKPSILAITKENVGHRIEAIRNPVRLIVLVLVMHAVVYSILSLPVLARQLLIDFVAIVTIALIAWLLTRLIEISSQLTRIRLLRLNQPGSMAIVHLVRRLLKACVIGLAALVILERVGVNLTAVLAGVSVVGIAIALAAQKTLENLFGGVMLITDQPMRVGDYCTFGTQGGTVEDIGLRSTRFRTPGRTVISVPNGQLAGMNIENYSERDKILFNPTIGLRYETNADQVRFVLAEIRRLLYAHSRVETASARVRFVKFDNSALNLEIFSYILTPDFGEFLTIQEDLLLRIMDIVEGAGSGMAFPSQTVYFGRDTGLDTTKAQAATQQVEDWRKKKALPFPDFHPSEIKQMENKITYPPPESSQSGE